METEGIWETSIPSVWFCYEHKTALKKPVFFCKKVLASVMGQNDPRLSSALFGQDPKGSNCFQ